MNGSKISHRGLVLVLVLVVVLVLVLRISGELHLLYDLIARKV